MNIKLRILKPFVSIIIFILALSFERASWERTIILAGIFTFYTIFSIIRGKYQNKMPYLFIVDIAVIFILEYHSKYLINYFFHSLYIVTILESGIYLSKRKWANGIAIIASLTALGKFLYFLIHMPNAKTTAEFLFNLVSLAFLITLLNYGRLQSEEKQKNNELYRELLDTYKTLREYSLKVEQASALEERTRIAGEIHDSVGHHLTAIIMQIEMLSHLYNQNQDITSIIQEIKTRSKESLSETRRAIGTLREQPCKKMEDIGDMINSCSKDTGVEINYILPQISLTPEQGVTLYRVIQEAITNAIRHGRCTRIEIKVTEKDGRLWFSLEDNGIGGQGCQGFGQRNMQDRINMLGGSLTIYPGKPYRIEGSFPLGREVA